MSVICVPQDCGILAGLAEPVTICCPFGENAQTSPATLNNHSPLSRSHTFTVLSSPPVRTRRPSGENPTDPTLAGVTDQFANFATRGGFPNASRVIFAAADNPLTIERESHRENFAGVAGERP